MSQLTRFCQPNAEAALRPRANSSAAMDFEYEGEEDAGPAPLGNPFNGDLGVGGDIGKIIKINL